MQIKIRFTSGNESIHPTDASGHSELIRNVANHHYGEKSPLRGPKDTVWVDDRGTLVVIQHIETISLEKP